MLNFFQIITVLSKRMRTYYEYNDFGELVEVKCETLPSGRYKTIDDKWPVRVGRGRNPSHFSGSDDLGVQGVLNPVNGKIYDSRSQYTRDVNASGHVIMGTDAKVEQRQEIKGNYDCRADVAKAIEQVGGIK